MTQSVGPKNSTSELNRPLPQNTPPHRQALSTTSRLISSSDEKYCFNQALESIIDFFAWLFCCQWAEKEETALPEPQSAAVVLEKTERAILKSYERIVSDTQKLIDDTRATAKTTSIKGRFSFIEKSNAKISELNEERLKLLKQVRELGLFQGDLESFNCLAEKQKELFSEFQKIINDCSRQCLLSLPKN